MGRVLLPAVVAGVLALAAWGLSPRVHLEQDADLLGMSIDPDSLAEGRHFGPFQKDSILQLVAKIDTGGRMARVVDNGDSLQFERPASYPPARFRRIFQNQRSSADFRRLKNSPVVMLPGEDMGFSAPIEEIEGVEYVVLPYDVVAGWMTEYGNAK